MSIYSGFATRNQQKYYDKVIYNLISTLMVRIVKFYKTQIIDEKAFKKIIKEQHKIISKLQNHKYLDPKYANLLEHFIKTVDKNQQEKQDNHFKFQMRRKSIDAGEFNRTLSVLGNQINQLKDYSQKIDTLEMLDDLNSEKDLQKIPQKRPKHNVSKKKQKKPRNQSIKSNIDIWQVRRQKLPQIPNLQPIQQTILSRTRFHNFSDKLTNKTIDDPLFEREGSNSKILVKPPKFKAKVFFK